MSGIYDKREIPDDLQQYFVRAELGLEQTPQEYVANMVEVFRLVRELLADDGTVWCNLGDSYAANRGYQVPSTLMNGQSTNEAQAAGGRSQKATDYGLKPKDLIGIPWRIAFALQEDGWYLRQDIIWAKKNPMPESVTDRCTKSHEYIFLLSKSQRYYFDHEAIKEPLAPSSVARLSQDIDSQVGSSRVPGKTNGNMKAVGPRFGGSKYGDDKSEQSRTKSGNEWIDECGSRNKRSVWEVATQPFSGAHFATFPPALIEPCILAGSRPGDIVLDPFLGSGTTAQVAQSLGRQWIGCELNPAYEPLQKKRTEQLGLVLA